MKIEKQYVHLILILIAISGCFTASMLTGYVNRKDSYHLFYGEELLGEFTSWAGSEMNSRVILNIHVSNGSLTYWIFEDEVWSDMPQGGYGYLSAFSNNNITLSFENINSIYIRIGSYYCMFTIRITVVRVILGPELTICGVITLVLVAQWLIKTGKVKIYNKNKI